MTKLAAIVLIVLFIVRPAFVETGAHHDADKSLGQWLAHCDEIGRHLGDATGFQSFRRTPTL
jgi:hypothetical protein